jgi:hypothetical protein
VEITLPDVVAEVHAAFARYETALDGINENLHGWEEIGAFRMARPPAGLARKLSRTVITTYGRDFATASTLFSRESAPGKIGRQMQTWVRMPDGWHVVAAHVSTIDN